MISHQGSVPRGRAAATARAPPRDCTSPEAGTRPTQP
jgi:hypothetical protein